MKKFLSYLWPITQQFTSEINGCLEVTYINGKKLLDAQNANYSYGLLQKILEFGLDKIDLKSAKNVLVLGMGGGSIIRSLRENYGYNGHLIAVEIDPKVIQIAKDEFGITESQNQRIVQDDALQYVKYSNKTFQLIIIDLFIDTQVPPVFYEKEFCQNVTKLLAFKGSLIFNIGMNLKNDLDLAENIISNFGEKLEFQINNNVKGINSLLIGKKSKK